MEIMGSAAAPFGSSSRDPLSLPQPTCYPLAWTDPSPPTKSVSYPAIPYSGPQQRQNAL